MAARTTINYLDIDDVKEINDALLPVSERGFLYEGGIDFILYNAELQYDDLPKKEAIIGKAAYLWFQIANNQYFVNGNKRTGFTTADVFLRINGLTLTANIDEKHVMSLGIANGLYSVDSVHFEITQYIK